jgi:hypothetical protein
MFVRQVRAHFKPEKFDLFNKRFEKEVIPMLQKQKGFRDELSFFDKEIGIPRNMQTSMHETFTQQSTRRWKICSRIRRRFGSLRSQIQLPTIFTHSRHE